MMERSHIEAYIMAMEDKGAIFVELSWERKFIKFEVPTNSELIQKDLLKGSARALHTLFSSDMQLLIKRIDPNSIVVVACEREIDAMFKSIMEKKGISAHDFEVRSFRNFCLRSLNITMADISNMLMEGFMEGFTFDQLLRSFREVMKLG